MDVQPIMDREGYKMKKVTAYQCVFCEKIYLSRSGAGKHEKKCWLNPARRSCATCGNLMYYDGREGGWRCTVRNIRVFREKIEQCPYYDQGVGIFNDGQEYHI